MLPDRATSPPDENAAKRAAPAPVRLFAGLRIVVTSTLVSRVLGMIRDVATAGLFGLGPVMDAFAFAFRIPNMARRLFGEGALSAAFLPAFTRALVESHDGRPQLPWQLASAVLSLLALLMGGLVVAGELLLWGLSFAFEGDDGTRLLLGLTAVMLPYAVLICLAAQVTAMLHALGDFTWPSLVPVVLNLCWIGTIWVVDPWFDPDRAAQAYSLAVCVVVAGALQLAMQWPSVHRLGFRFQREWGPARGAVRSVLRGVLPVAIGLSITQINSVLDSLIAWLFSPPVGLTGPMPLPGQPDYPLLPGAVSALYYGERVYQFPLGVFGVALGTVLFPRLSRHAAGGEMQRLRDDLSLGLRLVLMIGLPASVGLVLVADPLARVLYQHGDFSADDAQRTARMIAAYGGGVWAYCAIPLLFRGFYSVGERNFPVKVGMAAIVLDLVLNLALIWPLAERGLAVTTAVSAAAQAACLAWAIQSYVGRLDWRRFVQTTLRTGAATAIMAIAYVATRAAIPAAATRTGQAIVLVVTVGAAVLAYFAAARLLGLAELWLLFRRDRSSDDAPDVGPPVSPD